MSDTNQFPPKLEDSRYEHWKIAYQEVCTSYHAIDDFRAKLLGFLPLASGTGIFFLLNMNTIFVYLGPIGLFGFVVTLGLFLYELSGHQKCHRLMALGVKIEGQLKIEGQFTHRFASIMRSRYQKLIIEKTLAACVIYSAVLAAWIFVALVSLQGPWWMAALVFFISFAGSYTFILVLEKDLKTS